MHAKGCDGIQRSAQGDRMLVELSTNPRSAESARFVLEACAAEPRLSFLPYEEVVQALINLIMSFPKTCPSCGVGDD